MNAKNLALATPTLESALTTEAYLTWLNGIKTSMEAVQGACEDQYETMQNEPGQGGTRGPWLNSINESLNALLEGALAGAIDAANEEELI